MLGGPTGELAGWIWGLLGRGLTQGQSWHPIGEAILALLPFGITYLLFTRKDLSSASAGNARLQVLRPVPRRRAKAVVGIDPKVIGTLPARPGAYLFKDRGRSGPIRGQG